MLNIIGKRENGYHILESVFQFLPQYFDVLKIDTSDTFNKNSAQICGVSEDQNSIIKAAYILKERLMLKVPHVTLDKHMPICGGIGGGSSNSACFINAVLDINGFSTDAKLKLVDMFYELGADNKVFLYKYITNEDTLYLNGSGLDGLIQPINIDLSKHKTKLVFSNEKLSTKDVYAHFNESYKNEIGCSNITIDTLKDFSNSLQKSAIELCPSIQETLNKLKNQDHLFCGVSGSGPTCFAVI